RVGAVVLRGEDHDRVERGDPLGPGTAVVGGLLGAGLRRGGLVEGGQGDLAQVDEVDLEAAVGRGADPLGHLLADAVGAGTAEEDSELRHSPLNFSYFQGLPQGGVVFVAPVDSRPWVRASTGTTHCVTIPTASSAGSSPGRSPRIGSTRTRRSSPSRTSIRRRPSTSWWSHASTAAT